MNDIQRIISTVIIIINVVNSVKEGHSTRCHHSNKHETHHHKTSKKIIAKADPNPRRYNPDRYKYKTTKDWYDSHENISLGSYSFEPLEWSDNRMPETRVPLHEHVSFWKDLIKEVTSRETSDPEATLDPDLSHKRYYQCVFCFDMFDDDYKLKHHYHTKHYDQWVRTTTVIPQQQCLYCMDYFNQSDMRHHQETVHKLTSLSFPWERTTLNDYAESFDTGEAKKVFDKRFEGSYDYHTWPKNNTFFMTMYDIDSNQSEITNHYIDPWPNYAN